MRRLLLLALCTLAGCVTARPFLCERGTAQIPRLTEARGTEQYIVVLRPGITPSTLAARTDVGGLRFVTVGTLDAGVGLLTARQARRLARRPDVLFVQPDYPVEAWDVGWHLDRVDQRALPLDGAFVPFADGEGADLCLVDTGADLAHPEWAGRLGETHSSVPGSAQDGHGHGTHVAGIALGSTFGVAKQARLHACRALDDEGFGSTSSVVECIGWCVSVAERTGRPTAINMSLGGPASAALDLAVCQAVEAGVPVVVAAGNAGANACEYSPARTNWAVTVGATDNGDHRAWFSNRGPCLDAFAPGQDVTSARRGDHDNSDPATYSGTSMAAPCVTGAWLLYRDTDAMLRACTRGALTRIGAGSPNEFVFVGAEQ